MDPRIVKGCNALVLFLSDPLLESGLSSIGTDRELYQVEHQRVSLFTCLVPVGIVIDGKV